MCGVLPQCFICVDFTVSECCRVFLPIVGFFRIYPSVLLFPLQSEGRLHKHLPLSGVLTNTTFNVTVPAKQPCNAGLCPSPFPLAGCLVAILAPPATEQRPNVSDLLSPASLQGACWARRASPIRGSLQCKPNDPAWRCALASWTVPRELEKPLFPIPWPATAQPFGEWPKKPGHLLGSMQERALELYFLFKLIGWVDQHKYLGVEHISRELIIVIILCRLFSRVSIQEGFEIASSD